MRWKEYEEKAKREGLISYRELHSKYRKLVERPLICRICKKEKKLDFANKSGNYQDKKTDWFYLCRSCHMRYDKVGEKAALINRIKLQGNKNGVGNKSRKGKKLSLEERKAISIRLMGHITPNATKEKIRASMIGKNKGRKRTPEAIEKSRQFHIGRKNSEETKQKMRESRLKWQITDETRQKMSFSAKNRVKQAELINKL